MSKKISVKFNYNTTQSGAPSPLSNGTMLGRGILIFPRSYDILRLNQAVRECPVGIVNIRRATEVDDMIGTCQFASIEHFGKAVTHFIERGFIPVSMTYVPKLDELKEDNQ